MITPIASGMVWVMSKNFIFSFFKLIKLLEVTSSIFNVGRCRNSSCLFLIIALENFVVYIVGNPSLSIR